MLVPGQLHTIAGAMQVRAEEEVMARNREHRLAQYRARRERDWDEAIAREQQLAAALQVCTSHSCCLCYVATEGMRMLIQAAGGAWSRAMHVTGVFDATFPLTPSGAKRPHAAFTMSRAHPGCPA